jgi:hypothetical protein
MNITIEARPWSKGWELWLAGEGITQVKDITHAAQQVKDYLDSMFPETDHSDWDVLVTVAQESHAA